MKYSWNDHIRVRYYIRYKNSTYKTIQKGTVRHDIKWNQ